INSNMSRGLWSIGGRIPCVNMMRQMLMSSEVDEDQDSLELLETCNQTWRTQYDKPSVASLGIGLEFAPRKSRLLSSSLTTQEDDTENQVIGNSSLARTMDEYLAESDESEDENLVQFLA
ncbi:hypothetical protein KR074_008225, partial [Drosophila pseudoananassae]